MPSQSRLIVLGTGHSESMDFYNTNALIETPTGRLLIDCGYTIKPALRAQGLRLADIDAIFITHVHADHCFGLERAAIESRFGHGRRQRLIFHRDIERELWDQTLQGVLGSSSDGRNTLDSFFEVQRVDESGFEFGGVRIRLYPTAHTPGKPCFGLLINERIAYTSDTTPIPETLLPLAPEIVFHDATLAPDNPVHASLAAIRSAYPEDLRARMYLQSYEDHIGDYLDDINRDFAGIARQGQQVLL